MRRRALLASVPAVALAGCTTLLTDEDTEFSAAPAAVPEETLEATGYRHVGTETETTEFEPVGRSVVVTNHVSTYGRTTDTGVERPEEPAQFVVVSTPRIDIVRAGRSIPSVEPTTRNSSSNSHRSSAEGGISNG